jgi:hypothetical protein
MAPGNGQKKLAAAEILPPKRHAEDAVPAEDASEADLGAGTYVHFVT